MATPTARPFLPLDDPLTDVRTGLLSRDTWRRYFENLTSAVEAFRIALTGNLSTVLVDTHANRLAAYPPANYSAGATFYESDRGLLFRNVGSASWQYVTGTMTATFGNEPTDLGATDVGVRVFVSNFRHTVRWDGAAWTWADGDLPGRFSHWLSDPGAGYGLCDGSTYDQLTVGATLGTSSVVTPDLSDAYLKGGTYTGTVQGASAPGLSGSTATATATISGQTAAVTSTGGMGGADATVQVEDFTSAAVTVASESHGHSLTMDPHQHGVGTLAVDAHSHAAGTLAVDASGQPERLAAMIFVRL